MKLNQIKDNCKSIFQILRWNKPTGRLILLIPAGWSLWLAHDNQPSLNFIIKIVLGGLLVSGFGCIANDIWDIEIDKKVLRTKNRPLAAKKLNKKIAFFILILLMTASLFLILSLLEKSNLLPLFLSLLASPFILIYPSTKRWFKFPQLVLSFCWGFAVLIPWAVIQGNLNSYVLWLCWLATFFWTFAFDTIYALADKKYDLRIGINSSAIHLKSYTQITIQICYFLTAMLLGAALLINNTNHLFWPIWILASVFMQKDTIDIFRQKEYSISKVSKHFRNQVIYGSLFLACIIISN